ncbi:hypothetical protein D9M68_492440 [compost metagenome]
MKTRSLLSLLFVGLLLGGCHAQQQAAHPDWLETPALPIIQDAVFSLSPTFDGQRNPAVMTQVCALAGGETRQEQVDALLREQGADPARLPRDNHPLALLVNGDQAAQRTACAAYLATSVLLPVNPEEFLQPAPTGKDQVATAQRQIDQARLLQTLPTRLAEARANAEVFARIASELQRQPGLTPQAYRQQAAQAFARLAPVYLQRVRQQMPPKGTAFRLRRLDDEGFAFTGAPEIRFEYAADGLLLHEHGVLWYGAGKLLGKDYPLQVAY